MTDDSTKRLIKAAHNNFKNEEAEINPTGTQITRRFIVHVGVGDVPPLVAQERIKRVKKDFKKSGFFMSHELPVYVAHRGDYISIEHVPLD